MKKTGRLALAASALAAAALLSGCNTLEQAMHSFTQRSDEADILVKCSVQGDENACLRLDRYNDVKNQCTIWESGIACAELGKIWAYGENELRPEKVMAQKYFDMGCQFKSKESCDLALKFKNGTMPKTAAEVLPEVEVSSYDTQMRAFVGHTLFAYIVNTCPGPISETRLEQAANFKAYARKHYPSLREEFPEYWTGGMGMLPDRDKMWYREASARMNRRPGAQPSGLLDMLFW